VELRRVQVLFALAGVAEGAILPFLPIVLHERGLSAAEVGAVLAIAAAVAFVGTPAWGYLADRRLGAGRALGISSLAAAALAVPLAFADGLAALTVAVVLVYAARCATASLCDAIALDELGENRAAYGRLRLWMSVGWAVAVCVWGLLLQLGSIDLMPWIYAVSALVIGLVALRVAGPRVLHAPPPRGSRRAMARALSLFLLSLLVLFAAYSATFSFVAIRIDELGGGLFVIGLAAGLQAVAETPVMRVSPWLSRFLSDRAWYVVGSLVLGVSFAAWAFIDEPVAIALVKLVAGVGFALAYVGSVLIVDDLVPEALRGTGQGLARAVCFGLAPILGSLVGGVVYDLGGPAVLFVGCGLAAALAGVALVARPRPAVVPVRS
jgi:MFS transporter, PPP family, 3-phenylpropionic acid transporter